MAKIIITREYSLTKRSQNHNVYILNNFIGNLKNGETIEAEVDVGIHMLTFTNISASSEESVVFNAVVNDADEVVRLKTKYNMDREYEVMYDDTKPHIPIGVNSKNFKTKDGSDPTCEGANTQILRCPRCGNGDLIPISETSTQGKNFDAGNACCGYLLCGPLGLLFGASGKGKQTITTTYWLCKCCGYKFQV